ncbi:hypothetical protein [Actinacidiphila yeochonensis]|uniref:hypothetical protein n=1 Tax=Actinacidiphila yeochonensis TaxID=89050 RepID=UPI00099CB5BA|nr:hypothetical protein [Actinacidiphila yeochonensis]
MAHHTMSSVRIDLALRAPEGDQRDNPFAPPPEGAPDRPWQPRQQPHRGSSGSGSGSGGGSGPGQGSGGGSGSGDGGGSGGGDGDGSGPGWGSGQGNGGQQPPPPVWGSQWSSRQPQAGRPDPFARQSGQQGPTGPQGQGPRFDPTDPAQRRSRYALMCGVWGLFSGIVGWTPLALLLGALSLYWGISALRMSPEERAKARAQAASALAGASQAQGQTQTPRPAPPAPGPEAQRSFTTAAWTGIVTSVIALAMVGTTYGFQLAYRDYYDCKADALTSAASQSCQKLLPSPLRDLKPFRD